MDQAPVPCPLDMLRAVRAVLPVFLAVSTSTGAENCDSLSCWYRGTMDALTTIPLAERSKR